MRTKLIAELATSHGGDLQVAEAMIRAAAEAGCDAVKIQHYGRVNPKDPQAAWLEGARLTSLAIKYLRALAERQGLLFMATPFDAQSLIDLRGAGVTAFKIASSESQSHWWQPGEREQWFVSLPWGIGEHRSGAVMLTAVPLYPTPLECVSRAPLLDGWSDHTVGLSACQYLIAHGAEWIEAHLTLPGQSRQMAWDKTPAQFAELRQYAEAVATMTSGVNQMFKERFTA
jgi:sialic acid synthase SpsE